MWEDRATPRLRQRLLPRSECGRLGLRAGGGEGIPVSRWVSLAFTLHPVLSLLFFFFFQPSFSLLITFAPVSCRERKSGVEAWRGWDALAHSPVSF